jgi:L-alanine-DL-glutamate epimerase-like enolase superfamily enzyme
MTTRSGSLCFALAAGLVGDWLLPGEAPAQATSALADPVAMALTAIRQSLTGKTMPIDAIEFYGVPVKAERRFSFGVQKERLHIFIRLAAAGQSGWTEANLGEGKPGQTLEQRVARMKWFGDLKGRSVMEALDYLIETREKHGVRELEIAELGLLDLAGKLAGRPTFWLLDLRGRDPVPGLYCILSDDLEHVRAEARRALEQNLKTHLKVKLYGKTETDTAVVRAAREVVGPGVFIVGDANGGYRREASDEPLDGILAAMQALREAGLSACEDPAYMTPAQWAWVQERAGELSLLPDVPMRPAWKSRASFDPAMGRIYNMHPHCLGSILETVALGRVIQSHGKTLMVGDASLVGPACPAWEQIAIGLGADWVEAIEKPQENDVFQRCVKKNPVKRTPEGAFALPAAAPGFGVELDVEKLREMASEVLAL